jgi:hypothetical protein
VAPPFLLVPPPPQGTEPLAVILEETIVGPSGFASLLFGFVSSTEPFVGDLRINVTVALLRTFRPHDFFFFFFDRPFCQRKE